MSESQDGSGTAGSSRELASPIVGIGASAGGLEALTALLRALPEDPGLSLVVVMHLAPDRASHVPAMLGSATELAVCEAEDGLPIERNEVYVIPPNRELLVDGKVLRLQPRPTGRGAPKPVDALFDSMARAYGPSAIGVVLSGADGDGTAGLEAIKRAGGMTFAQDETARVPDMPATSIATGAVDFVLPPDGIARALARLAERWRSEAEAPRSSNAADALEPILGEEQLEEILDLLRSRTGADLTEYKRSTVHRRILRRIGLHRMSRGADFVELLRASPEEVHALRAEILIHVTRFFRDPEAFRAIEEIVVPSLIASSAQRDHEPIRFWVPGCASGEEVYSLAICAVEALGDLESRGSVQIFGTDISGASIARARAGVYPLEIADSVSPERLRRFFMRTDQGFQIGKSIRDLCIFASHDVALDPPFSRLDLISCRNVMIYMTSALQKRLIPLFHYGLRAGGFLLLGNAESVGGSFSRLFSPLARHTSLYAKVEAAPALRLPQLRSDRPFVIDASREAPPVHAPSDLQLQQAAVLALLPSVVPPGVVINEQMEILHFLGRTGPYLEAAPGRANYQLLTMAKEGLRASLFHAVRMSLESGGSAQRRARLEAQNHDVEIRVTPLAVDSAGRARYRLVWFDEAPFGKPAQLGPPADAQPDAVDAAALARAQEEAEALRIHLQTVIDGYSSTHEQLQAANEEIVSSNEELQSTNEELQTTKEEVEATNEELSTINDELQARISELGRLNDDWKNVLASVQIPMVILDSELQVRSFTPAAAPLFNLIASDCGRPLRQIQVALRVSDFDERMKEVLRSGEATALDVQDDRRCWFSLRIRPYRTAEERLDGLILVAVDIDEIRRAGATIAASRDYAEAIVTTVRRPLVVLGADLRVRSANPEFYRAFAVSAEESEGRRIYELGNGQWDIPELRRLLEEVIPRDRHFEDFEVDHEFPTIGRRTMSINARRVVGEGELADQVLLAIDDITQRKESEQGLRERDQLLQTADQRKDEFLAMLAHELRNPLAPVMHAAHVLREARGASPAAVERATDLILRQTTRMSRLVDDLLDVSRLTRGTIELRREAVDVRAPLAASVEAARTAAEAARHALDASLPMEAVLVEADSLRLEQVFGNLLENAIKYTDAGGRIQIRLERSEDWAVVRIRDNGIGIAPEMQPHVFDLFAQADVPLDRRSGGLGIGLSVVQRLIHMHKGTVEVHSDGRGSGSEFIVKLPTLPPHAQRVGSGAAAAPSSDQEPRAEGRSHRVLIVEDSEDAAIALSELLGSWGHDVQIAHDGPAALGVATSWLPELLLVDIGLPGMTGYELVARLREKPCAQRTPFIVAMTGYGQEEDARRSRDAGFDRHMVKPADVSTLRGLFRDLDQI